MEVHYFGTGGLVRAYSESLQQAIEQTQKIEKCMGEILEIEIEYANFEQLKYYCEKKKINVTNIKYAENIVCNLEILEGQKDKIIKDLELKNIKIIKYKDCGKKIIQKS